MPFPTRVCAFKRKTRHTHTAWRQRLPCFHCLTLNLFAQKLWFLFYIVFFLNLWYLLNVCIILNIHIYIFSAHRHIRMHMYIYTYICIHICMFKLGFRYSLVFTLWSWFIPRAAFLASIRASKTADSKTRDWTHFIIWWYGKNGKILLWSKLLKSRFTPLFWLGDKIWEGSLHIAVIKYLLFKEDSQNFLKLMASSLCLDSITSIEPYIELFAELFYYR